MKITQVSADNIRIPLKRPVKNSAFSFDSCEYTVVRIQTDAGIEGWSFVFGMPLTKNMVELLAPVLIGENVEIKRLWNKLYGTLKARFDRGGISMRAISAVDIALWDILGKEAGMPVYRLLGGADAAVPVYYSGGHYPADSEDKKDILRYLEQELTAAKERGFHGFKIKIGGADLNTDLQRTALARAVIGPEAKLMLDAFCGYDAETIIPFASRLAEYDIFWLEEPVKLDDTINCAYVASRIQMPVAVGESQYTMVQFQDIIRNHAARILMPDVTYVGGFTGFGPIAEAAGFHGLRLSPHWCHDLTIQMALAYPQVINMEYMDEDSALFRIQKIIKNPIKADHGTVRANLIPGTGLILDHEKFETYIVP